MASGPEPTLTGLPTEILLVIFQSLDNYELSRVCRASRKLNLHALSLYLERCGLPRDQYSEIQLDFVADHASAIKIMAGLRLAVFLPSIRHLHCNFRFGSAFQLVQGPLVIQLMNEWPATLTLGNLTADFTHRDDYLQSGCYKTLFNLLETAASRGCKRFNILNRQWPGIFHSQTASEPALARSPWPKFSWKRISRHGRAGISPGSPSYAPSIRQTPHESIHIHADYQTQPIQYEWTIPALTYNSLNILTLVCSLWAEDWTHLLPSITLANLLELNISTCPNSSDLLHFLSRHPTLRILDVRTTVGYSYTAPDLLPQGALPELSSLTGYPKDIEHLLKLLGPLPSLETIRIIMHLEKENYYRQSLDPLHRAMNAVAKRHKSLGLSLIFQEERSLDQWLDVGSAAGRTEASMRCVQSLELSTGRVFTLSASTLVLLPRWLGLFPKLRNISLAHGSISSPTTTDETLTFVREIRKAHPRLQTLHINTIDQIAGDAQIH